MGIPLEVRRSPQIRAILCAALLGLSLGAQNTPPPPGAPAAKPQPVPTAQIPERLASATAILRAIAQRTEPDQRVSDIAAALPDMAATVARLQTAIEATLKQEPSMGQIQNLEYTWENTARTLRAWQVALRSRSDLLETDITGLKTDAEAWTLTFQAAAEAQLPPEIVSRVRETADAMARAQRNVYARRNELLTLQNRVSEIQVQVDLVQEHIEAAAGRSRIDLTSFDSPPIWQPLPPGAEGASLERSSLGFVRGPEAIRYYAASVVTRFTIQGILFLALLFWLMAQANKADVWRIDEDKSVRGLGHVVRRPFATAILLTSLIGFLLHSEAPQPVINILWSLLLVPLLRLMPGLVSPEMKSGLGKLAILYVSSRLIAFLPLFSRPARVLQLGLTAVAIGVIFLLVRQIKTKHPESTFYSAVRFGMRAGLLVLCISALCDVIGMVRFSRYLLNGLMQSLLAAVLVRGSILIARGFGVLWFRSWKGRFSFWSGVESLRLEREAQRALNLAGFLVFGVLALTAFSALEDGIRMVREFLATSIPLGALQFTVGSVVTFCLVFGCAMLLSRVIRFVLEVSLYSRIRLQRGAAQSVSKLLHYSVLLLGLFLAMSAAGVELMRFTVLAGALGVGLGFGLQNIVNNFVSGLILLFERPIQVGDNIKIGTISGLVTDIGIRASTIRTGEGADVVVPNGNLISSELTNWTLTDVQRRVEVSVGAGYGSDPNQVLQLLLQIAREHPRIARTPEPMALFTGFGDSAMNFVLRCWSTVDDWVPTASDLYIAVNKEFNAAGIEIPFPQRDLRIRVMDQELATKLAPKPDAPPA